EGFPPRERHPRRVRHVDQHRADHGRLTRWPDPDRVRRAARRLPRLHGDPRLEAGDAVKRSRRLVAAMALLLPAGRAAQAQSWEASFLAGFTPSASLDRQARELDQLDVRGGFTLGAQAGYLFSQRWSAEVLWARQYSGLQVESGGGKADLFTFTM